jgi:hypothetical protein
MEKSDEEKARNAAKSVGIDLPAECVPGVIDNLALLATHAALLDRFLAEHPEL